MKEGKMITDGACVCAGTIVHTKRGLCIPIEELNRYDGIKGINFRRRGGWVNQDILWMKPPSEKDCCRITCVYGGERRVLECSWDHPIYCFSHYQRAHRGDNFVFALFLHAGDLIGWVTSDGELKRAKVESIEEIGVRVVYNLFADKWHNYVANGILTHNSGGY